jgi:hypothetical protein
MTRVACSKCGAYLARDSIRFGYTECGACSPTIEPALCDGNVTGVRHDLTRYADSSAWGCSECKREYQRAWARQRRGAA